MKPTVFLPLLAILCAFCGCANSGQTYAGKHPELSTDHRKILTTGKIPEGTAVAGMTREQVRAAMGVDPVQFTKVDDQDAWVFVKEQGKYAGPADDAYHSGEGGTSDSWFSREPTGAPTGANDPKKNVRTTVIFNGERAVRAEVSLEKASE